jgi:hypothetical protein
MAAWAYCPECGDFEPPRPKPPGDDPGCIVGFTLGVALVVWVLLAFVG